MGPEYVVHAVGARGCVLKLLIQSRFREFNSQVIVVEDDGQTDEVLFSFEDYQLNIYGAII